MVALIRRLWLRPVRRRGRGSGAAGRTCLRVLPALAGIAAAVLLLDSVDRVLRPQLTELVSAQLQNAVTEAVNDAVGKSLEGEQGSYDALYTLHTDESGRLSALTADTAGLNRLRTQVLEETLCQVKLLNSEELGVPVGNLTGWVLLSGRGPVLPVKVLTAAVPHAEFRNDFTAAGINQTLHRVMLEITVTVQVLMPGGTQEYTVTTPVCIAETVVMGQVPETYVGLGSVTP